jgi:predicted metal-dependent enzyme (double-stranded beta helix superfamily)
MSLSLHSPKAHELIARLDAAVGAAPEDSVRCRNVKRVLESLLRDGEQFLPPEFCKPLPDVYARRLLHRDPKNRYTAVVMVWGKGQGTPLHDHAGMWCCECVYQGVISVTSYSVRGGDPEKDLVSFEEEKTIRAGVGQAGALIPPFEYHILRNAGDETAVTIHVYGGEMDHCHIFEPAGDNLYKRNYKELTYRS